MLASENELLTQTDRGTPMGELWRRFWLPVMLASELPGPDCDPIRLRILGDDLVAFRDSAGRVGILDAHCAHRGSSLFFGRNEQGGLRCIYHGWKFDVEGRCLDMPNAPPDSPYKDRYRQGASPCREAGGFVWAYLGPGEAKPELPRLPFVTVPDSHRYVQKMLVESNYLQALEGDIDNSHASVLHGWLDPDASLAFDQRLRRGAANRVQRTAGELPPELHRAAAEHKSPVGMVRDTVGGITMGWRRDIDPLRYQWRINHWLMPGYALVANGGPGTSSTANVRVPIDDNNSLMFRLKWNPLRALSEEELRDYRGAGIIFPEMIPGTFIPKENKGNDYLIDREWQKRISVSGIKGLPQQDRAATDSMGPVCDRTKEHLLPSDAVIVMVRRRLIALATDLATHGTVPQAASQAAAYDFNPADLFLSRQIEWENLDLGSLRQEQLIEEAKALACR